MIQTMKPRTRDRWISEFRDELAVLRPDLSSALKFTYTVALHQWATHHDMDPRAEARQWAGKDQGA